MRISTVDGEHLLVADALDAFQAGQEVRIQVKAHGQWAQGLVRGGDPGDPLHVDVVAELRLGIGEQ